jgi:hypothetical protein
MAWDTLGNQNSLFKVSTNGQKIIVPVVKSSVEVVGFAVIDVTDLPPQFKTLKEAQQWVDTQASLTQHNKKEGK